MARETRIAITGIGPVASPGIGKDAFWQGLLRMNPEVTRREVRLENDLWKSFPVHSVQDFDFSRFDVDDFALTYMREWKEEEPPVDLLYLMAAVSLALDDSGIDYKADDNGLGLVLTHENMGLMPFLFKLSEISYDTFISKESAGLDKKEYFEGLYRQCLKSGYDIQTFMTLFHVAKAFNIHNYSLFINNACASGLYALESAAQVIRSSQSNAVVVAASEHTEIYKYLWFSEIGLYAEDGIIRPFDKDAQGLVFGDGGIGIVLEDLEHAMERNATIYAEYLGGGFHLEGWKVTTPEIGGDSYSKAIRKAVEQSSISVDDVELLCPHGIGSQSIDYYEAKAITEVFGSASDQPMLTAFKPYVGHNLGASALLEASMLLLSMANHTVLPTLNASNTNPVYGISLIQEKLDMPVSTAMKICCAFAGYNAAVVFKRYNHQ